MDEDAHVLCSCFTIDFYNHMGGRNMVNALIDVMSAY